MAGSPTTRTSAPGLTDPYNWSGDGTNAMPNCTWYVRYRAMEAGATNPVTYMGPAGYSWIQNAGANWREASAPWQPGDILIWDGHVAFVEGDGQISESVYTTGGPGYTLNRSGTAATLYNDVIAHWNDDAYSIKGGAGGKLYNRYWRKQSGGSAWYGSNPSWILRYYGNWSGGGGGGGNPDDPPDPQPGGHWEWVEETITTITSYTYTYSDIYECGVGTFGDQSGTLDTPQAPYQISSSSSRINQRWEPFNMYTDERTLTYTTDGQPVWSNWETKYTGSDNFPLGSQPTYGNGWEMEWQGDDD